jgi:hypothetical protein
MGSTEVKMGRLHRAVGLLGVVAFLATGLYMRYFPDGMTSIADGTRMMFRSRHVYFLLSSLLNLCLGTYIRPSTRAIRREAQVFGSLLILVGPPLLLTAFFQEPFRSQLGGPFATAAVFGLFLGIVIHAFAGGCIGKLAR